MTIEVEKSDITRIGHTCHSKDGFLEIFCKPDTANLGTVRKCCAFPNKLIANVLEILYL